MIEIDYREQKSNIQKYFENNNIDFKILKLKYADYLIDKKIAVERKTAEDFIISIIDGRLFKQIINLFKNFEYYCLIVERNPYKTEYDINSNAVTGALIEIAIFLQVPVLFTKNVEDTFNRIILIQKHFKNTKCSITKRKGYKPKNDNLKQLYVLQGLPYIGKVLSKRLLQHFKTLQNVFNAAQQELKKVKGINTTIANKLDEFIHLKTKF